MYCKLHSTLSCNACPSFRECRLCIKKKLKASKNCAACMLTKQPATKRSRPQHLTETILAYSYCLTAVRQRHSCARHANEMANCRVCILGNTLKTTNSFVCCNKHRKRIQNCGHCFFKVRSYKNQKNTNIYNRKSCKKQNEKNNKIISGGNLFAGPSA